MKIKQHKKAVPILQRALKVKQQRVKQNKTSNNKVTKTFTLLPKIQLHKQCSQIIYNLLLADQRQSGGKTIKSLCLAPQINNKKACFALVLSVLKYLPVLKDIAIKTFNLNSASQLKKEEVAFWILIYELLYGKGLHNIGKLESKIIHKKDEMLKTAQDLMNEKGVESVRDLLPACLRKVQEVRSQCVRINTLKISKEDAISQLQKKHEQAVKLEIDDYIQNVIQLPSKIEIYNDDMVKNNILVQQSWSSCLPAPILDPQPYEDVIDCCSAPGNKTTHLVDLMKNHGHIFAFEKDYQRSLYLQNNLNSYGANIVEVLQEDFLAVDQNDPKFKKVTKILCDPSCSGSGTIMSRMDYLLPSYYLEKTQEQRDKEASRLQNLQKFQVMILKKALNFPQVKRVVYSTCSINIEENEQVVEEILKYGQQQNIKLSLQPALPQWKRRGSPVSQHHQNFIRVDPFEDIHEGFFVALIDVQKEQ